MNRTWWKEAIVYQIYPRSFKDSNGDGVGDLRGIIEKLDYIKSLGVDAVWLNPIYKSPNDDGGYDISDYYSIQPEFGYMQDFDELLAGLHQRGLKLIMDLVLNHSSDEHPWFEESKKAKDNPYRDYYFWRPGKDGGPPNNWPSFFGGSAWQYDETTDEYYLHLFSRKQPDLNWENPTLRQELYALMKFWLDKGVDGLRLDVISAISKRTDFPDTDTTDFNETIRKYYANGPRLKQFIAEARQTLWRNYDVITVGEGPGITPQNALDYLDEKDGLNMIFHFGHMFMDQGPGGRFDPIPWKLQDFKQVFKTWDDAFKEKGWGSVFLGNHDFPRMVSRWGDDKEYWDKSAKLLITLLLTMRGTPFIFQGDEIGMTNTTLSSINQSHDIETINGWREAQRRGITESEFLVAVNYSGRDNARTPMQWNNENHAGFTSRAPWMELNKNKDSINVASQEHDPHSIMNYFRAMTALRKSHKVLTYGVYLPIETNSEKIFLFFRESEKEKLLIVLNFSAEVIILPDHLIPENALPLVGNYSTSRPASQLRPWEAVVYQCDKI
ncbi:MAG: alpha-glucosidase [Cyclobacteriaceae bacterium]|jgi:oligo-1,6-glucosidase|nr:alpha-glucosidase [Cyclobacteriaceae bacterium]